MSLPQTFSAARQPTGRFDKQARTQTLASSHLTAVTVIDKLERKQLQLEVEKTALETELPQPFRLALRLDKCKEELAQCREELGSSPIRVR